MKPIGLLLTLLFFTGLKAESQWSAVDSGATNGGQAAGLRLVAANSLKGEFAVDLPLAGRPGIECRSGGSKSNLTINFIFNNPLTSVDNVTASCGNVSSFLIDPRDSRQLCLRLTEVTCNAQFVTLTVTGAHDDQGNSLPSADTKLGLLLGDVNGDGVVNNRMEIRSKPTADKSPTAAISAKISTRTAALTQVMSRPPKHSAAPSCLPLVPRCL